MSDLLIYSQSGDTKLSQADSITPSLKLIGFTLGELNLALRIESVYKVVNHTPVYSSGLNHVGVAHLGDALRDSAASREVTVIDLYRRLFKENLKSESHSDHYLVIVQNTTGEFYGIPVAQTPVLIEVPASMIRILPESYRRADTLEIASHVAVVPQEQGQLTVFVLDVDLLLPIGEKLRF